MLARYFSTIKYHPTTTKWKQYVIDDEEKNRELNFKRGREREREREREIKIEHIKSPSTWSFRI